MLFDILRSFVLDVMVEGEDQLACTGNASLLLQTSHEPGAARSSRSQIHLRLEEVEKLLHDRRGIVMGHNMQRGDADIVVCAA